MGKISSHTNVQTTPTLARWLIPVLILLLTVASFFPTLQNGFVNWDDDKNLLENPYYRGLGWKELRWMFSTFYMSNYRPLTWVSLGADYLLWGMIPFGYHLTSLLIHGANTLLLYFVTLRLFTAAFTGPAAPERLALKMAAAFAALLFGVHPLRVEAVAWASARNDVLGGLFFLSAILCYLRYAAALESDRTRAWMMASVVMYALSLFSKGTGMILPVVLLVFDVYPLRRLGGGPGRWFGPLAQRVWWEKAPHLLLAVGAGVIALIAKEEAGATRTLGQYGIVPRLGQSLFGLAFYLWKTSLPIGLSPLYELPLHINPWDWRFLLSGAVVLALSAVLLIARRQWPAGLAVWICYVVVLAPVLGITQSGPQITADRYSYLSCLGFALLLGAALLHCWRLWIRGYIRSRTFALTVGLATATLAGLGVLTWKQVQVWHDSESLWKRVLAVNPSKIAHNNLANALAGRGQLQDAIAHYREALQVDPTYAPAYNNLGLIQAGRGEFENAIEHYRQALRINPAYADAHTNLGNALVSRGEVEEAIYHFRQALRINPSDMKTHNNLGLVLANHGELEEAIRHFTRALESSSFKSEAHFVHFNLANALAARGQLDEATKHYQEALKIQPRFAEAHYSLGRILAERGQLKEAIDHFRQAINLKPDLREAQESLSRALALREKR